MYRTDIIQYFIDSRKFQSYLEIGVFNGDNFRKIKCAKKEGVDPASKCPIEYNMTSDDFFKQNKEKFDIVFIDGLHLCEQVYKDIKNSLNCLNPNGVIVLHDILPISEIEQRRERIRIPGRWNGDCWKAFLKYKYESPYLCYVMNYDEGCGIIDTKYPSDNDKQNFDLESLTYQFYINHKNLFRITQFPLDSIEQYINSGRKLDVWTCNFNNERMTNYCIKSIIKNFKSIPINSINIFDNSLPEHKFILDEELLKDNSIPINVIDNTKSQIINFDTMTYLYTTWPPNYVPGGIGSFRHAITIRYILHSSLNDIMLFDNDILLRKDIDFINPYFITAGWYQDRAKRITPFCQYFNINLYRQYKLEYTSSIRPSCQIIKDEPITQWENGSYFTKCLSIRNIPYINITDDYIFHLGNGSHRSRSDINLSEMCKDEVDFMYAKHQNFINSHKECWE